MGDTLFCSLSVQETVNLIHHAIVDGSITGECIDSYSVPTPHGGICVVLVYEKHYYRAGNRLTLTVVVDDFAGRTRVHTVGGGGGEGLFRFDWGASESFSAVVDNALAQFRV